MSELGKRGIFTIVGVLIGFAAGAIILYAIDYQNDGALFGGTDSPGTTITGAVLGFPAQTVVGIASGLLGASIGGLLGSIIDRYLTRE